MLKLRLIAAAALGLSATAFAADPLPSLPAANDDSQTSKTITTDKPAETSTTIEQKDDGVGVKNSAKITNETTQGKGSASSESLVSINKAGASELSSQLGLTSEQANAIVKFRRENGPIGSDSDLRSVNGLDAATIKRLKGRVDFAKADSKSPSAKDAKDAAKKAEDKVEGVKDKLPDNDK